MTDLRLEQDTQEVADVLTVEQVARLLHCSIRTVERSGIKWAKFGRLRRYLKEDVLNHLRARRAS